jgi:hypothetical protein
VALTNYIVLGGQENGWQECGQHEAHSASAAIRAYAARAQKAGTLDHYTDFVAVPARSWQPVTVKIETEEHVRVIPGQLTITDAES